MTPDKGSENNVARVLAALRDTQAPAGMESRILRTVQNHVPSPSIWRLAGLWSVATFVTAAILLALSLTAHKMVSHRQDSAQTESKFVPLKQVANSSVGPYPSANSFVVSYPPPKARSIPAWGAAPGSDPELGQRAEGPTHRASLRHAIAGQQTTGNIATLSPSDALALSEMQAPSQPAPPMPLTEQERLLLRVLYRHHTVELAALDPMASAARNAREDAEFKEFFAPPPEPSGNLPMPTNSPQK